MTTQNNSLSCKHLQWAAALAQRQGMLNLSEKTAIYALQAL
jgi:hypothetical protein